MTTVVIDNTVKISIDYSESNTEYTFNNLFISFNYPIDITDFEKYTELESIAEDIDRCKAQINDTEGMYIRFAEKHIDDGEIAKKRAIESLMSKSEVYANLKYVNHSAFVTESDLRELIQKFKSAREKFD